MSAESTDRTPGDYRLIELREETEPCRVWLAEQVSVSRRVLVTELRPEQAARRQSFLADVRARAAVDHPLISSVYEAVDDEGRCYFAHELLHGETLDDRCRNHQTMPPSGLVHVLLRLADAQIHHEEAGQATLPPELRHLHLDEHGVIRIDNLAIAGARSPGQSQGDIIRLGSDLVPLVATGQPAANRMLCLLGWMRGEQIDAPLTWPQIRTLCQQIEQQLAQEATDLPASTSPLRRLPRRPAIAVAFVAIAIGLPLARLVWPAKQPPPARAPMPQFIVIPAGSHPSSDGPARQLPAFGISPHEVTIGQYAGFLATLDALKHSQLERTYDHPKQPPAKSSHLPDDWPALHAAAKSSGNWRNQRVSLDSPVVGVDWWDAAAYADWKKASLPTHDEWLAALHGQVANPAAIPPGRWQPVTDDSPDRTPGGLLGMAGSVCEWTATCGTDPANPLGGRKWLIAGGSFRKTGSQALTREWADDRSLRRPDLGFRIVSRAP
jgi:hypothetical protein